MSKPKTQKAQRDEAYLASLAKLDDALPGQLDIDGSTVGANSADLPPALDGVPDVCPGCNRVQTYASGWAVAWYADGGWLICGGCSHGVRVAQAVAEEYRASLRHYFNQREASIHRTKRDPLARRQRGSE